MSKDEELEIKKLGLIEIEHSQPQHNTMFSNMHGTFTNTKNPMLYHKTVSNNFKGLESYRKLGKLQMTLFRKCLQLNRTHNLEDICILDIIYAQIGILIQAY